MQRAVLLLIVLFLAGQRFYHLGGLELQPWDEGLYATRALSIVHFGDWLDQSGHAIEGLYSASHPPLLIWLTALTMHVLGETPLAARLWSALFGALTILLVYAIPRDRQVGFFAAFVLGTCSFFTYYSRQGQLDVTYTFFIIAGLFTWLRFERSQHQRWLIATGAAFGLAMLSKIIVGLFLPMILGTYLAGRVLFKDVSPKAALRQWAILFGIGLLIAGPWHLFMVLKHGRDFLDFYLFFHIYERTLFGVESNVPALGAFFFINQLVVMMSVALVAVLVWLHQFRPRQDSEQLLFLVAVLVPFIVITLSQTKLRTYAIPVLPPLSILAGYGFHILWQRRRVWFPLIVLTALFGMWAFSLDLRSHVKQMLRTLDVDPIWLAVAGGSLIALFVLRRFITGRLLTLIMLGYLFVYSFIPTVEPYHTGFPAVANLYRQDQPQRLIYIDNREFPDPVLSYYLHGANLDWQPGLEFTSVVAGQDSLPTLDAPGVTYVVVNVLHHNADYFALEFPAYRRGQLLLGSAFYRVYRVP